MLLGADLRCHCLNFHGRVKEASVKNFQLVRLCCLNLLLLAMLSPAAAPAVCCKLRHMQNSGTC